MTTLIDQTSPNEAAPGIKKSRAPNPTPSTPQSLYAKRVQIYPKLAHGLFRNLKWLAMIILLGIYYVTPWIRWDRGVGQPDQAVLIDFENARFYFFFIEIWPQEVYYITGLLVLAALGLFLVTAMFGRVWCGYACPQTIWTDLFIYVERFFEGDRNARIKLNRAPWTARKLAKKSGCTYMCPWPRIQAAMIDEDALNVTYRYDRGEARGPHKKGATWEGRGDCIDCRQCVAVCPVGIDIRDGLQLECIGCALCIDACNGIMDKVERPRGLIAYDTDANVVALQTGGEVRYRIIRPRTILYAVLFIATGVLMLAGLMNRSTLDINVLRDRQPNFVKLTDGSVRNGYTLKVMNKATEARQLELGTIGLPSPLVRVVGQDTLLLDVPADEAVEFRVLITEDDLANLETRIDYRVFVKDVTTDTISEAPSVFVSGGPK